MNLPLMLIPLILPRPPPLRSFAAHDPALKAMKCEMLAFVMSTKIVETSEVRVAVLIGTEETAFRESAEFRGSVGRWPTETMLEKLVSPLHLEIRYLLLFEASVRAAVPGENSGPKIERSSKVVSGT
jgi:hypothetical protein